MLGTEQQQKNWRTSQAIDPRYAGSPSWYLISSKPTQEHIAVEHLNDCGVGTLLPMLQAKRVTGKHYPLFPRYLFGYFPETFITKANLIPGVHKVVRFGDTFAIVDPWLIEDIVSRLDENGCLIETVKVSLPQFNHGDRVQVTAGPLQGLAGVFDVAISGQDRAQILLNTIMHYAGGTSCNRELRDLSGGAFRATVNLSDLALSI